MQQELLLGEIAAPGESLARPAGEAHVFEEGLRQDDPEVARELGGRSIRGPGEATEPDAGEPREEPPRGAPFEARVERQDRADVTLRRGAGLDEGLAHALDVRGSHPRRGTREESLAIGARRGGVEAGERRRLGGVEGTDRGERRRVHGPLEEDRFTRPHPDRAPILSRDDFEDLSGGEPQVARRDLIGPRADEEFLGDREHLRCPAVRGGDPTEGREGREKEEEGAHGTTGRVGNAAHRCNGPGPLVGSRHALPAVVGSHGKTTHSRGGKGIARRKRPPLEQAKEQGPRINEQIRISPVRLIGDDGEQIGVVEVGEAMMLARDRGLDLVEVSPKARPVVCKLMDFGRYKYEQKKQVRDAKKKEKSVHIKTVRFRPNIEEHDYETKVNQARRFLIDGDKVKVECVFRRREMRITDVGKRLLDRITTAFSEIAKVEQRDEEVQTRSVTMLVAPIEAKVKPLREQREKDRAAAAAQGREIEEEVLDESDEHDLDDDSGEVDVDAESGKEEVPQEAPGDTGPGESPGVGGP
ncbi:MAG: translation initiation factor IF-3 [Planctomycetes bacterium]|nr:translation initiation factor IF-3 [Planctomycetota bacterium]